MDVVLINYTMPNTSPGVDDCKENPLARATKNLLYSSGQPFKRLSKVFFQDPSGCIRWFGIFIYSAGSRVLFFPGFTKKHDHLIGFRGNSVWKNALMDIDHISLEKDGLSWHITSVDSVEHVGKIFTQKISGEIRHWFSLSVAGSEYLRVARETTVVSAEVPANDSARRVEVLLQSREDAIYPLLSVDSEHLALSEHTFLHFSVLFGVPDFDVPESFLLGIPYDKFVTGTGNAIQESPVRIHRMKLDDSIELMIIVSAHEGVLEKEFIYTGYCATDI